MLLLFLGVERERERKIGKERRRKKNSEFSLLSFSLSRALSKKEKLFKLPYLSTAVQHPVHDLATSGSSGLSIATTSNVGAGQ